MLNDITTHWYIRRNIANDPSTPIETFKALCKDETPIVRYCAAASLLLKGALSGDIAESLAKDRSYYVANLPLKRNALFISVI